MGALASRPLVTACEMMALRLLLQELQQPLLAGNQGVDAGRLTVEEGGDCLLLGKGRHDEGRASKLIWI